MSRADVPPFSIMRHSRYVSLAVRSPPVCRAERKCTGAAKQDSTLSTSTGATGNVDSNCREAVCRAATPFRASS